MTNEEIILSNRVFLMENGVIKGTGKMFTYKDEHGSREIEIPEEIHTFQTWKSLGFAVKRGERSIARFPIWHKKTRKKNEVVEESENGNDNDNKNDYYYMRVAFFFTGNQVEPIKTPREEHDVETN